MSNMLNNGRPKKRLLDRGPKIVPDKEFTLDTPEDNTTEPPTQEFQPAPEIQKEAVVPSNRRKASPGITSVRVTKNTRNKLNALIQLDKADSVDTIIDILIDEYIESNFVKDEKKTYNLILDIIQKRDR